MESGAVVASALLAQYELNALYTFWRGCSPFIREQFVPGVREFEGILWIVQPKPPEPPPVRRPEPVDRGLADIDRKLDRLLDEVLRLH